MLVFEQFRGMQNQARIKIKMDQMTIEEFYLNQLQEMKRNQIRTFLSDLVYQEFNLKAIKEVLYINGAAREIVNRNSIETEFLKNPDRYYLTLKREMTYLGMTPSQVISSFYTEKKYQDKTDDISGPLYEHFNQCLSVQGEMATITIHDSLESSGATVVKKYESPQFNYQLPALPSFYIPGPYRREFVPWMQDLNGDSGINLIDYYPRRNYNAVSANCRNWSFCRGWPFINNYENSLGLPQASETKLMKLRRTHSIFM